MASVVSSSENVCVSPIVARLLGGIACSLDEESSPLNGVREEFERLHGRLAAIQAMLEDAEEKQLGDRLVKDWLRELRESVCDAEDVFDSIVTEHHLLRERDQLQPVNNSEVPSAAVLKTQIGGLLDRLDGIDVKKEKLLLRREKGSEPGDYKRRRRPGADASRLEDAQLVVGREGDKSNLLKRLLTEDPDSGSDDGIAVIPIIGMGGLGKTTLSHLVFKDAAVCEHFESRMWVNVTDDFDLKRILREMIKFHSKMDLDPNMSEATLESRLLEFIRGTTYLLILDGVWPENCGDWEKLKMVLDNGKKGSRVLITSRIEQVSEIMGTREPYILSCLPEDKCLSLFNKIAFEGQGCFSGLRKELEQIGKGIVQKCKGLPLAVKAMAGLLSDTEDIGTWKNILKSEIWEVDEEKAGETERVHVLPALQLSYYHLPSNLKQCFAYCSIFPKSYVFDREDLVKLWMAEGFLWPGSGVHKSPQEVGSGYFDELLMRSFFQVSNIDRKVVHKMHDLIHDMAVSVSKPYYVQVKGAKSNRSCLASRHISLTCKDAEQPLSEVTQNSKKLRTLLCPTGHLKIFGQALGMLFVSLPYLRALDLSSSEIKQLPDSIAELKLLRYLDLSETEIQELPNSICRLYNLETLKLLRCRWLYKLPEDLSDLVNLSHLELDDMFWFKATSLPPRMGNLTKLRDLNSFIVGQDPGQGIGELNRLACLVGTLHISKLENARDAAEANMKEKAGLQKVVFQWSSIVDPKHKEVDHARILEDLQPHTNLKVLQVSYYNSSAFPSWLRDGVLRNLTKVSLAHCINCKILSLGDLPHLRELNLKGLLELEECLGKWPLLGRLNISSCPKLRVLPPILPNMNAMKIIKCENLEVLPIAPFCQFLTLESNSSLKDWQEVRVQFVKVNEQGQVAPGQLWSYSNLLEMKVSGCPKLDGLPEIFAPQKLEIHHCELMDKLPSPQFARRLQHLALVGCHDGTLVRAIPSTGSLFSLVLSGISNLSAFPEWPLLPGLKALYINDCEDLESLSSGNGGSWQGLASVKLLSVQNCPRLITLAVTGLPLQLECLSIGSCPNLKSLGPRGSLTSLTQLKDVYISDCPALDSLPEDGLPVLVEHLRIENCPLLQGRCDGENGGPEWPKIKDIPDVEMVPTASCTSTSEASLPLAPIPTSHPPTDLSKTIRDGYFQEWSAIAMPSNSECKSKGETSGSSCLQVESKDLCGTQNAAYDQCMETGPMAFPNENCDPPLMNTPSTASPGDDSIQDIGDDLIQDFDSFTDSIMGDINSGLSQSDTPVRIPDFEILEALSALRRLFALDPVDANDLEHQSSSFDEAIHVIDALDQSYGLESRQVEGLHHMVKDWRDIAHAASTARKVQQQLQEQLSTSDLVKTSLLDTILRNETLKREAELLEREDEEDQLKIKELEDSLEQVRTQSSQIKSRRLVNVYQAKQLNIEFTQLRREAVQHKETIMEAETSLSIAEQQWSAFRDTVVEVTSLFK